MTADHRTVLTHLTTEQRASLLQRSNRAGLRHLAIHFGLIILTSSLIVTRAPWWPLFVAVQGLLIVFLFTTLHETVHRTPFRSPGLNDGVGAVCGCLNILSPVWFKHFHLAHHRWTNDPHRDPELAGPKPNTKWQYAVYVTGIPEWISRLKVLFTNALTENRDAYVPDHAKAAVKQGARIQLAIYAALIAISVATRSSLLVTLWLVPLLLGGPFLRMYLLAEHGGCPHVANMFENTRTTYTNILVRFFAWNMPYHAEHHAFPGVPFHKLPEFHVVTKPHLQMTERGYLRFNRQYTSRIGT